MAFRTFFDRHALWLSMLLGAVGYPLFLPLMPILPPLIFLMLFFTFCKVNPLDLRLRRWHIIVLLLQLVLGIGTYYLAHYVAILAHMPHEQTDIIAQGLMVCILMPTATAAPIIAGKLGGSIQNLTSFTLLSNITTALLVPIFFPIVNPVSEMPFHEGVLLILYRVAPLLLGPFLAAWLLRIIVEICYKKRGLCKSFTLPRCLVSAPFYIWVCTLVILMADITHTLLTHHFAPTTLLILCIGALLTCMLQFYLGHRIGYYFPAATIGEESHEEEIAPTIAHDMPSVSRITAGQAFGQKNTTLGIWLAQAYLHPLSAIAPAAYILVQNLYNSLQLYRASSQHKFPKKAVNKTPK